MKINDVVVKLTTQGSLPDECQLRLAEARPFDKPATASASVSTSVVAKIACASNSYKSKGLELQFLFWWGIEWKRNFLNIRVGK